MIDPRKTGRPGTKLMEPPKTKPARKESEQVPAGDDSDINEGRDYIQPEDVRIQPEDVRDDRPPKKGTENKPVEKDKDSDENSGCAC
jgi:hypothetical protein